MNPLDQLEARGQSPWLDYLDWRSWLAQWMQRSISRLYKESNKCRSA